MAPATELAEPPAAALPLHQKWGAAVWGVVAALSCAAITPLEPNMLEEGLLLHFAERMVDGERLYTDLLTFTGPLPYVALSWLFEIFGPEIYAGRFFVAGLHGLSAAAAFTIARRGGAGVLSHFAGVIYAVTPSFLFPLFSIFFYTTIAFHFSLFAFWAALAAPQSLWRGTLAGALIAATALTKQTLGLWLAALLLGALALGAARGTRLRAVSGVVAGGAACTLAVLVYYALRGELGVVIDRLVLLPLSFTGSYDSPLPNFWPIGKLTGGLRPLANYYLPHVYAVWPGEQTLKASLPYGIATSQFLFALPFIALALTAIKLLRRRQLDLVVWLHTGMLVAMTTNLFPRADWGHLTVALPPAFVQLVLLGAGPPTRWRRGIALTLCAIFGFGGALVGRTLYSWASEPVFGPRVPQRQVGGPNPAFGAAAAIYFLRQNAKPGEAIFVARSEPLIYFATATRNPTPYPGVIPAMREEQQRVILEALEHVRFVVMSDIDSATYTYYRKELPEVAAYLERHYRVAPYFTERYLNLIYVLERHEDLGRAVIDFSEIRDQGRFWIRVRGPLMREAEAAKMITATSMHQRPLPFFTGREGGGVDFEVTVPERAALRVAAGHLAFRSDQGAYVADYPGTVSASLRDAAGVHHVLGSTWLNYVKGEGWTWEDLGADLADYAGQQVRIRFEYRGDAPSDREGGIAFVGSPRIVVAD